MNILLIEPDRLLARTYKQALERAGHRVMVAATAQAGIHAADDRLPELVILEMQLVSHSGIEFLYEFRSYTDWQLVPVLVLSQVPPAEFINSWDLLQQELGVQQYLYKPRTNLEKLLRAVNEFTLVKQ
jgi:DNA-binding response OmpR family regulator